MSEIKFKPIRGKQDVVLNLPYLDGAVYFTSDTGRIYMDSDSKNKIPLGGQGGGGSNSGIFYGTRQMPEQPEEKIIFTLDDIEGDILPSIDDLILNAPDGCFYRVIEIETDNTVVVTKLTVAGNGGSTEPTLQKKITVTIDSEESSSSLVNGQDAYAKIQVFSAIDSDGSIMDEKNQLSVTLTMQSRAEAGSDNWVTYYTQKFTDLDNEAVVRFNFGKNAKESAESRIIVYAEGPNSGKSQEKYMKSFTMSELVLTMAQTFSNATIFDPTNINITCNALGEMNRILDFYWDEELVYSKELTEKDTGRNVNYLVDREKGSHGYHTVRVELYQYSNGERKNGVDPISFEVGVNGGAEDPVIWLNDYKESFYNYEDIEFNYYIYYPGHSTYEVTLYKDNIFNIKHSFEMVNGTIADAFEIADADEDMQNFYTITCDTRSRDIFFNIIKDPNRQMEIQQQLYLDTAFTAKGRSNSESETNRALWSYTNNRNQTIKGVFKDFNWYNNGWIKTPDGTALRISNGASFSIPIGAMSFNSGSDRYNQSHTFEFQFKIRNVQSYDNLISNITRYKNDDVYYNAFYGFREFTKDTSGKFNEDNTYFIKENDEYINANIVTALDYANAIAKGDIYIGSNEGYKTSYTNYDAFLQWYASQNNLSYDDITANYDRTQKIFNLSAIACGYYSGTARAPIGFGLGPQDAFFSNGTNTVNASYVEDKLINLAITYSMADRLMSIYVNGILTGVITSTLDSGFTIDSDAIVFNSQYCDIDLYKMRIYYTDLSINEIVTNYAVDLKDVTIYDQNTLVNANNKNLFDFEAMLKYNENHPTDPIMPYIVFDTSNSNNGDRLSWSKKSKQTIGVEFVNTVLDRAYISGELESLAKRDNVSVEDYYLHHCPSWKGENISMAVQGTSSEFYPRRNYKLKTKDSDGNINMIANRGPFASNNKDMKWFYMDNYTAGTTKFTMKIDFMESSGSYNRGLANLVAKAYPHHPLWYYAKNGAITKEESTIVEAATFKDKTAYSYYNHKGNLKTADGLEDNLPALTAETFAKGPVAYYQEMMEANPEVYKTLKVITDASNEHYNKWYEASVEYVTVNETELPTKELRTSVQGFPVLAFHKKSDGTYTYIGRYNMLTDKGSDETYGFKYDGYFLKNLKNKAIKKKAECWEFENNTAGYCSFRDPLNRKTLSFNNGFLDTEITTAPKVVEDFEYRYSTYADSLDLISGADSVRMDKLSEAQKATIKDDTGVQINAVEDGQDLILDLYGNWEKAVRWVWSTCLDADFVKKQAEIDAMSEQDKAQYLLKHYVAVNKDAIFEEGKTYYKYEHHLYNPVEMSAENWDTRNLFTEEVFTKDYAGTTYTHDSYEYRYNKFKYELEDHFNMEYLATYFVVTEALELYDSRGKNCMMASWGPLKSGGDYVWFPIFYDMDTQLGINNTGIPSFEFSIDATEEGTFSTNDSVLWNNFYEVFCKSDNISYIEVEHKDIDFSSGKVYYLGTAVNGITSYKAISSSDSYSDSDRIYEKITTSIAGGRLTEKYNRLKGQSSGVGDFEELADPPFTSPEKIEAWYESDPSICKSIVMRGQRPLSAINLDEWYKYIAITSASGGGYLGQNGEVIYDNIQSSTGQGSAAGSYYYALQGDRSLSRIQFLTNRFNYLDSWLGVGAYDKSGSGSDAFWGRLTANNTESPDITSDKWIATTQDPYFQPNGEKTHEFDSEYWVTLTPSRKSYASVIIDDSRYRAKYINNPVKIMMDKLKKGIETRPNYKEQLIYILGTKYMESFGDLYKLYLTELHTVEAKNLTELLLGWDGLDRDGKSWYNHETNAYGLAAMPLLKEANLSNIQYSSKADSKILDFSNSEKLQNFRATGSNFEQIKFAEGVALNTLYLPNTLSRLELVEARQLKGIIEQYEAPTKDPHTGKLVAKPGLYIQNFTDNLNSEEDLTIGVLSIVNAYNLGYGSYKLLDSYRKRRKSRSEIDMTNVNWSPYRLLDEGAEYDANKKYYLDDKHFGLVEYSYNPDSDFERDNFGNKYNIGNEWNSHIANKELFVYNEDLAEDSKVITDIIMLDQLAGSNLFISTAKDSIPNISGIIYVNNDRQLTTSDGTAVDEFYVRNTLQKQYPNMRFLFKNLTKNYTAKFILVDEDNDKVFTTIGTQTIKSGRFTNPIDAYGDITEIKPNYDFYGWATKNTEDSVLINLDKTVDEWASSEATLVKDGVYDYTFYAVFKIHSYTMTFIDGDKNSYIKKIPYGQVIAAPDATEFIPVKNDSALDLEKTYGFKGWALSENGAIVNLKKYNSTKNYTFYAIFNETDVHDNVDYDLFDFKEGGYLSDKDSQYNIASGYICSPKAGSKLKGKVTIPAQYNGLPVIAVSGFANQTEITCVFIERNSTIRTILAKCFSECNNLKYFEFTDSLRYINENAFTHCSLINDSFGNNVFHISSKAFTSCFASGTRLDLKLSGTITELGGRVFNNVDEDWSGNNLGLTVGSTLTIGSPDHFSDLDLTFFTQDSGFSSARERMYKIKHQYRYAISTINFYTKKYTDVLQELSPVADNITPFTFTVKEAFDNINQNVDDSVMTINLINS